MGWTLGKEMSSWEHGTPKEGGTVCGTAREAVISFFGEGGWAFL